MFVKLQTRSYPLHYNKQKNMPAVYLSIRSCPTHHDLRDLRPSPRSSFSSSPSTSSRYLVTKNTKKITRPRSKKMRACSDCRKLKQQSKKKNARSSVHSSTQAHKRKREETGRILRKAHVTTRWSHRCLHDHKNAAHANPQNNVNVIQNTTRTETKKTSTTPNNSSFNVYSAMPQPFWGVRGVTQ